MTDEERMTRLGKGDFGEFGPLYEGHRDAVWRYATLALGSRALGEDVAQETFLRVFRERARFRGGSFAAWLFTIARNQVRDALRSRAVATRSARLLDAPPPASDPLDALADRREAERLRVALDALPEDDRALLLLREAAALPYRAIATMTGRSEESLRVEIHRIRRRLRDTLPRPTASAARNP